jgi:vancomycin resistance protein VanJ
VVTTTQRGLGARGRVVSGTAVAAGLLAAALMVGHGLVPNVHGLGSALDTVAPLLVLAVPLLLVLAGATRSRPAALVALVPLVLWAAIWGRSMLPGPDRGAPQLRVASQNLRADNPDPAATARAAAAAGADLLALEEVTADARDAVEAALAETYPYHVLVSTVGLWSRYPIGDHAGVDTALGWTRALRAVVDMPSGPVTVYAAHLGSARPGYTATRDRSVRALADAVAADPAERLVVTGDLNTATGDRVMRPLTDLVHDAQADAGRGPGATWPAALPLIRPDHVLYRGLTASAADVQRTPGTDHRAVTAGFRF